MRVFTGVDYDKLKHVFDIRSHGPRRKRYDVFGLFDAHQDLPHGGGAVGSRSSSSRRAAAARQDTNK